MKLKNNIYLVIGIAALYLMCQMIADVTAVKIVQLWGMTFAGGTFIYALTFTARDLAHKQMGKKPTVFLIWAAAFVNVFMALYFVLILKMPYPAFWVGQDAMQQTLGIVPRIVGASIAAEIISELVDTELYQFVWKRWPKANQMFRVLGSNAISAPLDSLVFVFIAFYGTMPIPALFSVVWGQTVWKWILTIVSMPSIYLVPQNPDVKAQIENQSK
jgi:uncharacterized integral membrane protein (TIGR00697 family)